MKPTIFSLAIVISAILNPLNVFAAESEQAIGPSVTLSLQESIAMMKNKNIDLFAIDACFTSARHEQPNGRLGILRPSPFRPEAGRKAGETMPLHLTRHYYELALAHESLVLQEHYLEELDTHYRSVKKMYTKGLIAHVELLKVKSSYEEGVLEKLELENEERALADGFKRMLRLAPDFAIVPEALPRFMPEFASFEQWLQTNARNRNIIAEAELLKNDFKPAAYFPAETVTELQGLYADLHHEYERTQALEDVVKTTAQILTLQIKRFQNTLATSDEIIAALAALYAAKARALTTLYTYHSYALDAELIFESLKKK